MKTPQAFGRLLRKHQKDEELAGGNKLDQRGETREKATKLTKSRVMSENVCAETSLYQ
jgi:hypothetical protein